MRTIVELPTFTRKATKLLTEDEYADLLVFISFFAETGDIIRGGGGFRKLRWARGNRGKSAGVRTVYFYYDDTIPVLMAAIYGKNEKSNLSQAEINDLYNLAQMLKGARNAR